MSVNTSYIWVFSVNSRTSWYVQLQASLQLVYNRGSLNCLLSIKVMGRPAVSKTWLYCVVGSMGILFLISLCWLSCCGFWGRVIFVIFFFSPITSRKFLGKQSSRGFLTNLHAPLLYFATVIRVKFKSNPYTSLAKEFAFDRKWSNHLISDDRWHPAHGIWTLRQYLPHYTKRNGVCVIWTLVYQWSSGLDKFCPWSRYIHGLPTL